MTEPVFEIVKQEIGYNEEQQNTSSLYTNLILHYLSSSYGYYTETFISKISQSATQTHQQLGKFNLKKLLRESSKAYALSDLEIVFVSYFTQLHQWNIRHPTIIKAITTKDHEEKQYQHLKLFLSLIGYFVKSYVGNQEHFQIIHQHIKTSNSNFLQTYEKWVKASPPSYFIISPKQLNQIYTEHSKNCQKVSKKKNYNEMVDNIIDLSITYSIIPTKKGRQEEPRKRVKFDHDAIENRRSTIDVNSYPMRVEEEVKKPANKISLNKKKQSQPNQMILDYHNERGSSIFIDQKPQSIKNGNNSILDFGISYLDLRSNRSAASSGLPVPWKPTSGFFQKSRLD